MTGWRSRLTLGLAALAALTGTASPASADPAAPHHRLFAFQDPRISESSGLVDRGSVVFTINDSGDGPFVYAVHPRTGATVGVTTYSSDDVTDVEAIAPGRGGAVWVGDIGDNRASRSDISVYRVHPSARGDQTVTAPRYDLAYPDGARDAEALLVHPHTGRVFVVSKSVFGGTVYVAPRRLRTGAPSVLRPFARVDGLVTDGTFLPDGRHVVLRTYGSASVYTFPDFRLVGTVRLPAQRQGEAITVSADGRVLVSSEGVHSPVLEMTLAQRLLGSRPAPGATPVAPSPTPAPAKHGLNPPASPGEWLRAGAVAAGLLVVGYAATRLSRVRGSRR
jgi:sugar lactone lactonase YvrE